MRRAIRLNLAFLLCGLLVGCGGRGGQAEKDQADAKTSGNGGASAQADSKKSGDGATSTQAGAQNNATAPGSSLVSYMADDFFAALVVRPRLILSSDALQSFKDHELVEQAAQDVPFDFRDVEEAVLFAGPPTPGIPLPVTPGIVARYVSAEKAQQAVEEFRNSHASASEVTVDGKTYLRGEFPGEPASGLYQADGGKTLVISLESTLQKMLDGQEPSTELAAELKRIDAGTQVYGVVQMAPIREMLKGLLSQAGDEIPPPFNQHMSLVDDLKSASLRLDVSGGTLMQLELVGENEASVAKLEAAANDLKSFATASLAGMRQQLTAGAPPAAAEVADGVGSLVNAITVARQADRAVVKIDPPAGLIKKLGASIGPAMEDTPLDKARNIAIAMHNFHDLYFAFPADITDEDGIKLMSWRVSLLPFLEEYEIFDALHWDEPWDSPHNMKLLAKTPAAFQYPGDDENNAQGLTRWLAFTGNGALFGGETQKGPPGAELGLRIRDIADGTSNTLMFLAVPAKRAVHWAKPDDVPFNPENPLEGLGEIEGGSLLVVLCDASVRTLTNLDADFFKRLITVSGGEVVPELQ